MEVKSFMLHKNTEEKIVDYYKQALEKAESEFAEESSFADGQRESLRYILDLLGIQVEYIHTNTALQQLREEFLNIEKDDFISCKSVVINREWLSSLSNKDLSSFLTKDVPNILGAGAKIELSDGVVDYFVVAKSTMPDCPI